MPTIVGGDGPILVDDQGRDLIDVCSGPFLASLGQGNQRVLAAMMEQGRRLTYTYSRTTRHSANRALTQRLIKMAGSGFDAAHLTSGGSEANEMAVKMLRARAVGRGEKDRTAIVSLMPGYHGATVHTLGMNGDITAPELWGPLTAEAERIPAPLTFRAESPEVAADNSLHELALVVDRVGPERLLAVIVEPIGGQASGVNIPHPSFSAGLRRVCDETGAGLIFDEVVTAFRTGHYLATHHNQQVSPDLVTLAKGLGAGYAPLGAVLTSQALVDELADSIGFTVSHSYDANPMACAAGAAVLDEIAERELISNAEKVGSAIRAGLDRLQKDSPLVADVRGLGLLQAIELVADPHTNSKFPENLDPGAVLVQAGLDNGLLLYSRRQNKGRFGDWLLIAPPLNINIDTAHEIIARLTATIARAAPQLASTPA